MAATWVECTKPPSSLRYVCATWAVQGEVEPDATGLGGDLLVLIYVAKTDEVIFINGTGFAAQAATIDYYRSP
jgi:gamma-glutamyltranspeptidase/glutathione hydrolase